MSKQKVTQTSVSYLDKDGVWQTAVRGDEIEPHKDDVDRLKASGAFDSDNEAPEDPQPESAQSESSTRRTSARKSTDSK